MEIELLTKKEIAERLGLYTPGGNLNVPIVTFLLNRIEAEPYGRERKHKLYTAAVLPEIRKWFWRKYPGELPVIIDAGSRRYFVEYLPEYEDFNSMKSVS